MLHGKTRVQAVTLSQHLLKFLPTPLLLREEISLDSEPNNSYNNMEPELTSNPSPAPGNSPLLIDEPYQIPKLFQIEEILHNIFDHFSPPVSSSSDVVLIEGRYKAPVDKSTLLSAVLTCHAFREPALDALWRTLDSFLPFCTLLPILTAGEESRKIVGDLIRFDISSLLRNYQSRVQTLIWSTNKEACSGHYFMLSALGPEFLPNLRTLIIPNLSYELETTLLYALGSSMIQTIDIASTPPFFQGTWNPDLLVDALVTALCYRSRNSMQNITVPYASVPLTVLSLPSLKSVRLTHGTTSTSMIKDLSSLSNLKRVEFTLKTAPELELPFSSIEEVHLTGFTPVIYHFLNSCNSTRLRALSLRFSLSRPRPRNAGSGYVGNSTIQRLLLILQEKWGNTLTSLDIAGHPDGPFDALTFEELGKLPLTSLRISFAGYGLPVSLTLTTIMSHFPEIQCLHLPTYPTNSGARLSELCQIAQSHQNLRELTVLLNTEQTDTESPVLQNKLHTLHVYDSPVSDGWYVAEQLHRTFPNLKRIIPQAGCQDEVKWREVERMLQFARRIRCLSE
ncbi:hypothetical protein BDN72DRAFT_247391 [Pluteus cervinus]|uniref:Uncharacterized protein n=1 Tax=Pluteus cervinus TaxID=181527 RepID=A0ACD3B636_9AGAR|nr:hypothetical protein BDN72DRAFT_247391 [Pluteus cervinus]